MRIIKVGQIPEEKMYEKTCFNCKTVFEFQGKEAVKHYALNVLDADCYMIHCPHCNELCYITINYRS